MINKKIIEVSEIKNKYHHGYPRDKDTVSQIVIHGTGGGKDAKSIIRWMLSGEREKEYKRGIALFHYIIDLNGDIYNIINTNNWVYHSSSGSHDEHTIGIELLNTGSNNTGTYTDDQYSSLWELIFNKLTLDFDNINSIIGHGACKQKYSNKYKNCPGSNFNWEYLKNALSTYDYGYIQKSKEEFLIHKKGL